MIVSVNGPGKVQTKPASSGR
ncbi:spidroin-1-like [Iris pallida]|uniref:Spidroin-1-like n=1 Tax=Iris pallida TaxID=29817 RepID=A0AAX6J027_IRIPA|nr:spidroin-1-like [Iris pallida]